MHKLAAVALTAVLGVAGMAYAQQAEARVYVGIGLPGVALVAPPVLAYPQPLGLYAPYYYGRPYYYGPGFRYGYRGYGFHGYAYGRRWR